MVIEFFMAMTPPTVTHQEKQVHVVKGKPVFYEPADLKAARQKLMGHLAGHRPEQPFDRGVRLMVKWCFPKGKHADGEYRITKPDTDNLQKLLKDCMTAGMTMISKRKIRLLVLAKEKESYEFKGTGTAEKECDRRGLNYHVSVGGLDSIVLFLFLHEVCGIDARS